MSNGSPILLAIGLYVPGTGFTHVLQSLFNYLSDDFDIHWLGIGYKGKQEQKEHFTLYPSNLNGGDMYGAIKGAALAHDLEAQYVLLLCDAWVLHNYRRTLDIDNRTWANLAYIPLDGEIDDLHFVKDIVYLDKIIAYTEESRSQFVQALEKLTSNQMDYQKSVEYIYHGINEKFFYAFEDAKKRQIRNEIFKDYFDPEKNIILLNANRIVERKDIFTTLKIFAAVKQNFDSIKLVFHVPNTPDYRLEEFHNWVRDLHLDSSDIILNPFGDKYISKANLNTLYNACDIGINTSHGEGWGLISFEHGATGAAQLVPDHSASKEFWPPSHRIKCSQKIKLKSNPYIMHQLSVEDGIKKLTSLLSDKTQLTRAKDRSKKLATQEQFKWKNISKKWKHLLLNS